MQQTLECGEEHLALAVIAFDRLADKAMAWIAARP